MPPPDELAVPSGVAPDSVVAELGKHLVVALDRARSSDRTFVDTFDGRLRAAGITADETTAAAGGLAAVLDDRRLLPVARVRSRVTVLRVLNGDDKTVARIEVEAPSIIRRGQPPCPLRGRVRVVPVRGYDRAADRVLTLLTGELGLAPATSTLFDESSLAAGRPPAGVSAKVAVVLDPAEPTDVAVARLLARLAEVMDDHLPGTLADIDAEFLHDYRIAVRQTRAVLQEIKGVMPPDALAHYRVEFRWVQQVTGPLRDLDVHLEELARYREDLPPLLVPDLTPLAALLAARRASELRRMRRALRTERRRLLDEGWRELLGSVKAWPTEGRPKASRPVGATAARRISRVYGDMVRDGSRIDDASPGEALHGLRKQGKELRYLLELFSSLFPKATTRPLVTTLKALQDSLGRFQDREVQAASLLALTDELGRDSGSALMVVGVIVARLHTEQTEARAEFADRFATFAAHGFEA
jgi:CHAD domain-containing protein